MKVEVNRREKRITRVELCCGPAAQMFTNGHFDIGEEGERLVMIARIPMANNPASVQNIHAQYCLGCGAKIEIENSVRLAGGVG